MKQQTKTANPYGCRYLRAILLCLMFLITPASAAEELKLEVSPNREEIYIGESLLLTVKLSGSEAQEEPDLSGILNCKMRYLGSQSDSRLSIVIVNGRMQRDRHLGRIFFYEITPSKEGRIVVGPVSIKADGRTLSSPGPIITVRGIEKQDNVIIDVSSSRSTVLVDEKFTVRLSVAIKALHPPYSEAPPLNPGDPPTLLVPFLGQEQYPGLESPNIREMLQRMLTPQQSGPGMLINDYSLDQGPFSFGFMEQQKARFTLPHTFITTNGQSYIQYSVEIEYTPREEKSYTFGPVVFKGAPITGVDSGGNISTKPVFAVGSAVVVRVVPPPEENRPKTYIGAIGSNFKAAAELDTQTCNSGDPLKLTLTFSGNVNMSNIRPLFLNDQPDLPVNFKIYDDTIETIKKDDSTRQYTYTVRPVTPGTYEFPPIAASYFDTGSRSYKTVKTSPIPINVRKGVEIDENIIIKTATNSAAASVKISAVDSIVIAPFTMDRRGARPEPQVLEIKHAVIAGTGFGIFAVALLGRLIAMIYRHRMTTRKSRYAHKTAMALTRKARKAAKAGNAPEAHMLMTMAFKRYFGWRFGIIEAGVTPSDAERTMREIDVPETIIAPLLVLMEKHFNAVYASGTAESALPKAADIEKSRALLTEIESFLSSRNAKLKTDNEVS